MPRAGTTWLCRSLNQHREVAAFGESMFWGKGYIAPTGAGRYDTEEMVRVRKGLSSRPFETTIDVDGSGSMQRIRRTDIPGLVHSSLGGLEHASPGETFLRFCSGMAQADGKHHWIEKTPHHLIFAKRILKELPESRFVVTLREPYGFMLSYKHQPGHDASQKCARDFRHRYHPLGCALVWRNSLRAARRMLQEHSGQSMLVDLQDIERDPAGVLRDIQRFFLLDLDPLVTGVPGRVRSSFQDPNRPTLASSDVAWMNTIAHNEILDAGYRLCTPDISYTDLLRSTLDLPWWGARIWKDTVVTSSTSPVRHFWQWFSSK